MEEIKNVTIVGAGTMGHSLAQAFGQGGYEVWLNDVREEILIKAKSLIASNLKTLAEMGFLEEPEIPKILGRIHTSIKLAEGCSKSDFVLEAIFEDIEAKKALFRALDQVCPPETILASNTSFLDIFKFVETNRPKKVIIAHWYAPPHIVPLVEVVRGPQTSQQTVDQVKNLLIRLGKKPIVLSKFLPGFIGNRLQSALSMEVDFLLDNGYATAEDIDEATKASFGLRIPILGLVKRMDFSGLDLIQKLRKNQQYTAPKPRNNSETIDRLVSEGKLGVKSGKGFYDYGGRSPEEIMKERDFKLLKLREFLKSIGEL